MRQIGLIMLLLISYSNLIGQDKSSDLIGHYVSNFAIKGYGEHQIKLSADSTFNYEYTWCLLDFHSTGKYSLKGNYVNLRYDPLIPDTILYLIESKDTVLRPSKFLYKNKKLFIYKANGELIDKEIEKYTKQFIFFGQRKPRTKKLYLKKQPI